MSDDELKGDVHAALDFAERHLSSEVLAIEHSGVEGQILVTHGQNGAVVHGVKKYVDDFRPYPERREGCISVDDLDSFVFLVNRDQLANTVLFAGRGGDAHPYLVAVLDFHDAAAANPAAKPRFCKSKVRYSFPLSDEWKAWNAKNGQGAAMPQAEFAAFIEDHIFDVGEPGAAGAIASAFASKLGVTFAGPQSLMTVSRGLEVRSEQRVKEVRNLENGDATLVFEATETSGDGSPLKIPSAFHIMIPVFKNGPVYSIPVRLRRRTSSGRLVWFFEIHRSDLFLDDAISDAIKVVRSDAPAGVGLPVVMGTPP